MDTQHKIQGKNRSDVFEQLIENNTLIKMQIPDFGYEQLTMVTDLRTQSDNPFFIIDPPSDFYDIVSDLDHTKIHFEFNFKEGVQYAFTCTGGIILEKEIWVDFPDIIERIQRRKDFRLEFPKGSLIRFQLRSIEYEMDLINLSMGGAYAEISLHRNSNGKIPILKSGNSLREVVLLVPSEEGDSEVHIHKALIIRVEKLKTGKTYKLGLQFIDMHSTEVKILKKIIYDSQRSFLQNRLKPDV